MALHDSETHEFIRLTVAVETLTEELKRVDTQLQAYITREYDENKTRAVLDNRVSMLERLVYGLLAITATEAVALVAGIILFWLTRQHG